MSLWQAVVLGLVEGITEYLPISSTGHLVIAQSLMGLNKGDLKSAADDFAIVIQGGAILAVVGLYWPRMVQMVRGLLGKDPAGFQLLANLFVAFVPSAAVGLALGSWIKAHLFAVGPIMLALAAGALYMVIVDQWRLGRFGSWRARIGESRIEDVTIRQALMIGLLQCFALWPGTSRSMMTISGGMIAGLRPKQAAEFSFLLGLPTLCAATLYDLLKNLRNAAKTGEPNLFERLGTTACVVGIVVAAVSAAAAVRWLVGFLTRHGLAAFAWYRLALCVVLGVLAAKGVVSLGHGPTSTGPSHVPALRFDHTPTR